MRLVRSGQRLFYVHGLLDALIGLSEGVELHKDVFEVDFGWMMLRMHAKIPLLST
jgi:hypothetical protein